MRSISAKRKDADSWKFTNDKEQEEFGSLAAIMAYLDDLPDIVWPFIGFVRHVNPEGRVQLYIAHKRKDYGKGGEYVPALMRYDPNLQEFPCLASFRGGVFIFSR